MPTCFLLSCKKFKLHNSPKSPSTTSVLPPKYGPDFPCVLLQRAEQTNIVPQQRELTLTCKSPFLLPPNQRVLLEHKTISDQTR